jgi:hypothetical protein
MKRFVTAALIVALGALMAPSLTSAQISIRVGGAATFPMSDYGDYANTGWMGAAGVNVAVGEAGLGVGAHGFYGSNNHSDVDGDKTNLYGALGTVSYSIAAGGSVMPYVFGALGFMTHSYKSNDFPALEGSASAMAWGGGGGLGFPLGGITGSVDGFYVQGTGDNSDTKFFGVGASVSFPIGGDAM